MLQQQHLSKLFRMAKVRDFRRLICRRGH